MSARNVCKQELRSKGSDGVPVRWRGGQSRGVVPFFHFEIQLPGMTCERCGSHCLYG